MPIKVSSGTCLFALAQLILTSASEPEALRYLPFIRCIGICLQRLVNWCEVVSLASWLAFIDELSQGNSDA